MTTNTMETFKLFPGELTLDDLRKLLDSSPKMELDAAARARIAEGAATVGRIIAKGKPVYGLNTGFGKLAKTHISDEHLRDLQRNIVLSHAAGVGEPLDDRVVRLILILKANGLARGFSGVRPEV